MRKTLFIFLSGIAAMNSYAQTDTIKLYFGFGRSVLVEEAMHTIDSLIYKDILVPGKKLGIVGYADYVGNEPSNLRLSEMRAEAVKQYLLRSGFRTEDIQTVMGKGEISREANGTNGYAPDRKVEIIPGGITIPVVPKPKPAPPVAAAKPPAINIDLNKVKKNETIKLENIYFTPGSHQPTPESAAPMRTLYEIMLENPGLKIRIEGHICCLPRDNFDGYDGDSRDFNLSSNRAQFIYDFLIKLGINKNRLEYKGFGITKPVVYPEKNTDDENRNRRVEIRILEK